MTIGELFQELGRAIDAEYERLDSDGADRAERVDFINGVLRSHNQLAAATKLIVADIEKRTPRAEEA
jgi:hypothetical protein